VVDGQDRRRLTADQRHPACENQETGSSMHDGGVHEILRAERWDNVAVGLHHLPAYPMLLVHESDLRETPALAGRASPR
jgi:hypothetical protein